MNKDLRDIVRQYSLGIMKDKPEWSHFVELPITAATGSSPPVLGGGEQPPNDSDSIEMPDDQGREGWEDSEETLEATALTLDFEQPSSSPVHQQTRSATISSRQQAAKNKGKSGGKRTRSNQ